MCQTGAQRFNFLFLLSINSGTILHQASNARSRYDNEGSCSSARRRSPHNLLLLLYSFGTRDGSLLSFLSFSSLSSDSSLYCAHCLFLKLHSLGASLALGWLQLQQKEVRKKGRRRRRSIDRLRVQPTRQHRHAICAGLLPVFFG